MFYAEARTICIYNNAIATYIFLEKTNKHKKKRVCGEAFNLT